MATVVRLHAPIVVGGGIAGLSVALGLGRAHVISSRDLGSTWLAQAGIAAALAPGDSAQVHLADTMAAGGSLAFEEAVELLTAGAPEAIERLMAWGSEFDREDDGSLLLGREPGHRFDRMVHAEGDATGAEVMRALGEAVAAAERVNLIEARVVDLARHGDRVVGVVTADAKERTVYTAPAVVLATGGAGRIYSRTTNPGGATGDGIVMAARAGARLADLEFVQFHPTALGAGRDPMPVIPEVLRDEGARLVDAAGRPFMDRYHPDADLAPRSVVTRAVLAHDSTGSAVYLDARSLVAVRERYPSMSALALSVGLDPAEHLLPVSPAAHFHLGGIDADWRGRTSVAGLWAVGECASTGVHGADRLPGNSLLEGVVFGARAAHDVALGLAEPPSGPVEVPPDSLDLPVVAGPVLEDLRELMWERVGPVRTAEGLEEAARLLDEMRPVLARTSTGRSAADLAGLIILAAARRPESRGDHYRADHPETEPSLAMRALVVPGAVGTVAVN